MATIDIELPDELQQALTPPPCSVLQLPQPAAPTLTLPIGASFQGIADFTRGIPTECSMNISLMLQVAPMMASMECLLKVLGFVGAVVSALQSVTNPTQIIGAFGKIVSAGLAMQDCINIAIPGWLSTICFVKGLLELVASLILCTVTQLESVLAMMSGFQVQLAAAQAAGNSDLIAQITCAQENASTAAAGTMQGLQPVMALLAIASPFLTIAQISLNVNIPAAVDPTDLQAMQTMLQTLATVAKTIKSVADALQC